MGTDARIVRGTPDGTLDPTAASMLDPAAVLEAVRSRPEGLTSDEAVAILGVVGPNRIPQREASGPLRRLVAQLTHFFALMLWAAAVLAVIGGMPELGAAIVVVVIVNGVFSFSQEERAAKATAALAELMPDTVAALRDGRRTLVPAADLVPGDVLILREGDRISADGRILESAGLLVDHQMLTGESVPVARDAAAPAEAPSDVAEAQDMVFAGTFVAAGSAHAVVVATGAGTRLGGIATLTGDVVRRPTPLKEDLDRAVRVIGASAVTAGVVFFGVSLVLGMPARDGFLFAVGVIVALVPEGLLPTLTLALAMSATRMAHRGALVRRPESVETLGATTVICSDKTGTMTTSQMTARALVAAGHEIRATRSGWTPGGVLLESGRPLVGPAMKDVRPALLVASLCGDARLQQQGGRYRCSGDPTEGALLALSAKGGVDRHEEERLAHRIREFPFESERRRMSTVHRLADGRIGVLTKGSPEAILEVCTIVRGPGGVELPLDDASRASVSEAVERLADEGLRVLGLARRRVPQGGAVPATPAEAEHDMELVGLAGLEDPIRPEVPAAMDRCRQAGIRVVMITGDHPATAASVARRAGIPGDRIYTGAALPEDDGELRELLADPRVGVLARIAPEQKLRIARALQMSGHVVAMTGDGVNDAPALRQADIGVAMGITGTDVAREAADLVLLDDNFAHIVEAVEEGRAAFDNIRRFLTYHLTDNVAELAPFAVWALSGGSIPLLLSVLQVLALDIGTDLLPALALGAERPEAGVMERLPRDRKSRLLDRNVMGRAFGFLGPIEAFVSLAIAVPITAAIWFGWHPGAALPEAEVGTLSAIVFASVVLMQMANAYSCRSNPASVFSIGPFSNRLLNYAVGVEALALLAFIYLPGLYHALGGEPLTAGQWVVPLVTPFLLLGGEEARKAIVRSRARSRGAALLQPTRARRQPGGTSP
jgi:magnesium-transporting ATPase (P-type)